MPVIPAVATMVCTDGANTATINVDVVVRTPSDTTHAKLSLPTVAPAVYVTFPAASNVGCATVGPSGVTDTSVNGSPSASVAPARTLTEVCRPMYVLMD